MLKKIAGTFSTKLLVAIMNLVIVVLTTRYLGTSGKGEVSLIVANITLIQLINNFVGGTALVYLTPRHKTILLILPAYLWGIIASGIGAYGLYYLGQVDEELVTHIFMLSVIFSWFSIHQMIFLGKEKIFWHNTLSLLQVLILLLALGFWFLIMNTPSVEIYIFSIYVAYGLCWLLSFVVVLIYMDGFLLTNLKASLRGIFSYGFIAQIATVISFLNYRLSYYLLDYWKGKEAVGVYSTGVSIAEATWMLSKSIALVQYSRVSNEKDAEKSIRMTNSLTKLSFWMAFLIVAGLLCIPSFIYEWIFGIGFGEISKVVLSLAIGILSISFSTTFLHYFSGKGRYDLVNRATFIALLFTLSLSVLLIPKWGIVGAGLTASCAYLSQSIYLYLKYRKEGSFRLGDLFRLKEELNRLKESTRKH